MRKRKLAAMLDGYRRKMPYLDFKQREEAVRHIKRERSR